MNLLEKLKMPRKEPGKEKAPKVEVPVCWLETSDSVTRRYEFVHDGYLSVKVVNDSRPVYHRVVEPFLNKFFPSGYPYSVNEGYLRCTQFRALQHLSSAALSVLSSQSLLFAAGLRPTPAQATAVGWILKDGMQHMGKLICSNLGARMNSEPKRRRILGMAVVAARATRLPICSSVAKEGNLSDLFAKGEAISTLCNVVGIGVGMQFASTLCSSMQGKLVVGPFLSFIRVYSVDEEMRAAPVNTLNPQRTAMIVTDFLKTGKVSSPADLRYREDLLFPGRLIEDAGNVKIGRALHKVVKPSKLQEWKEIFPEEKFVLSHGNKWTDMLLEHNATGEDALRGWLFAAYAASMENSFHEPSVSVMDLRKSFESHIRYKGRSLGYIRVHITFVL
ncbi:protein root UVB sensitive 2, chloroplastic-like isoform X2 [Durio zibethinus]|uniref:Protein root UVB sensitive 2, chloroplastic-like isoform X2 n=1 Tax=Durio zibethinus TaxID=66656 RepID=A0A6P6A0Y4_DURZI|nr:protein root UVB sensitive 2, chloroplastic-like isoform X2 [Durio zibethinus]